MAQSTLEKLQKQISSPDYTIKIPDKVQKENEIKMSDLGVEILALGISIENFLKLQ